MRALLVPTKCLCSILLFALVAVMTPRATEAALLDYELTVSAIGFSANGTIGFDDFTGSGPADPDFANFSLTLTNVSGTSGLPFTFTKSMVTAIDWSIHPTTFALQLDLDVATQTVGAVEYDISLDSISPFAPSITCGPNTLTFIISAAGCVLFGGIGSFAGFDLTATQIVDVPEPGTLLLFGATLAGLGWSRRKRR